MWMGINKNIIMGTLFFLFTTKKAVTSSSLQITVKQNTYHKSSLFDKSPLQILGLFTRRMTLSFHKMSFSQVSHFVDLLKTYLDNCKNDNVNDEMDSSLDISMQSVENEEEEIATKTTRLGYVIYDHMTCMAQHVHSFQNYLQNNCMRAIRI